VGAAKTPDVHKVLKHELRSVEEAVSIKCAAVEAEVGALRHELEAVRYELPLVEKAGDDDRFTPVMTAFLEKSTGDVASLASGMERMRDGLMELSRFLGDDVVMTEPELVLQRIHAFSISFQKACRDNERAAFLKKKAAQEEQDKAERAQRAAAQASRVPGGDRETQQPAESGSSTSRRKVPLRSRMAGPGAMVGSIQGSLRRGEFKMMKQLQSQFSEELAQRMASRRSSIVGDESYRSLGP